MPRALGRGNSPRLSLSTGDGGTRKAELKAGEAAADRGDLKSTAAMDDNARDQRVHMDVDDARAYFEFALQRREIGIAPLPSRNFDANSPRRQVDDDRMGRSVQRCSPPESGWLRDQSGATLHTFQEGMMTNPLSYCRRLEPFAPT